MPLDTSGVTNLHLGGDWDRESAAPESLTPSLDIGPDIGAALKTVREFRRMSLEDLSDRTRIRRSYLAAIEEMRLEELPSRPFTVGYVRAYANALGLDGEAAVERFKADEPVHDESLRAPVGVQHQGDPRIVALVVVAVLMVGAIVLWNIAQRAMSERAPPPSTAPQTTAATAPISHGPVNLGAPLPAPVESTTPPPYETPGLEAAIAAGGVDAAKAAKAAGGGLAAATQPAADAAPLPAAFIPQGQVYGAAADASQVVFQARKSTSLIARGPDGSPYFARQLAAGEAYRAPMLKGLTVEVIEPNAVQLFVAGQSKGLLPVGLASVGKLATPPAAAAATPTAQ
ncbi:MAG TPA: helix-turn-helix transcriptional regulator [Phenylobacterium sp.]|nr:helix-turn-helix transcriptional regulator [Phenylobacterium sp.]